MMKHIKATSDCRKVPKRHKSITAGPWTGGRRGAGLLDVCSSFTVGGEALYLEKWLRTTIGW